MENTLFYDKKTGWDRMSDAEQAAMMEYAEGYKAFLDEAKTERDAVRRLQAMAEANGFAAYTRGKEIHPGEKYYKINRNKAIILFVVGSDGMHSGINLSAAHLDAPRIDIRTVPLYEDNGMALFKTHYYGGIKKYQWVAQPMALHGTVVRTDGTQVNVSIGEDPAAADSVGINIKRYKYIHICIGCAIMGVGGYYMGLNMSGSFSSGCWINGYGWIAVALVIFANWNPALAILGTFVFGFFNTLRVSGGGLAAAFPETLGWLAAIPSQLYQALPFLITALVLVGSSMKKSGSSGAPASLGLNYFREER